MYEDQCKHGNNQSDCPNCAIVPAQVEYRDGVVEDIFTEQQAQRVSGLEVQILAAVDESLNRHCGYHVRRVLMQLRKDLKALLGGRT